MEKMGILDSIELYPESFETMYKRRHSDTEGA